MTDTHASMRDDLPAYALGALDPRAAELVEMHLRTCEHCSAELAAYREAVGALPYGLPPLAGGRRRRLLANVRERGIAGSEQRRTFGLEGQRTERMPHEHDTETTAPAHLGPGRQPRRFATSFAAGWRTAVGWRAAAALALLLATAVAFAAWQSTDIHASLGAEIAARLPGGRILSLVGTGTPGAQARLYVPAEGRGAELALAGLPPLPPDRVYQLWFARPGHPTLTGGAFRVDERGQAVAAVSIPAPLADVTAVAVTEEPSPGSPGPTGVHLLDWAPTAWQDARPAQVASAR